MSLYVENTHFYPRSSLSLSPFQPVPVLLFCWLMLKIKGAPCSFARSNSNSEFKHLKY